MDKQTDKKKNTLQYITPPTWRSTVISTVTDRQVAELHIHMALVDQQEDIQVEDTQVECIQVDQQGVDSLDIQAEAAFQAEVAFQTEAAFQAEVAFQAEAALQADLLRNHLPT